MRASPSAPFTAAWREPPVSRPASPSLVLSRVRGARPSRAALQEPRGARQHDRGDVGHRHCAEVQAGCHAGRRCAGDRLCGHVEEDGQEGRRQGARRQGAGRRRAVRRAADGGEHPQAAPPPVHRQHPRGRAGPGARVHHPGVPRRRRALRHDRRQGAVQGGLRAGDLRAGGDRGGLHAQPGHRPPRPQGREPRLRRQGLSGDQVYRLWRRERVEH